MAEDNSWDQYVADLNRRSGEVGNFATADLLPGSKYGASGSSTSGANTNITSGVGSNQPGTGSSGYSPDAVERGTFKRYGPTESNYIDPQKQYEDMYQSILDRYGTMVGGPNAAVLRSLNQGIQDKNAQYKKNTASVENMYGQLTQESENAASALMDKYQQAIGQTGERSTGLQNVLSQEGAVQDARRANLAAELGISPENALTQYGSQQRLNEAMGQILSQGQSWQGLLESQKLSARQQADRMRTAIGNTKSATKLGLTEAYQNAINNYKSQIAQEKSKQATMQLNPFGEISSQVLFDKYKKFLGAGGTDSGWRADQANKFDEFSALIGKEVTNGYNSPEFSNMLLAAQQQYEKLSTGGQMSPQVVRFMQIFDIQPSDLVASGTLWTYGQSGVPSPLGTNMSTQ